VGATLRKEEKIQVRQISQLSRSRENFDPRERGSAREHENLTGQYSKGTSKESLPVESLPLERVVEKTLRSARERRGPKHFWGGGRRQHQETAVTNEREDSPNRKGLNLNHSVQKVATKKQRGG